MNCIEMNHPLINHKLSLIRNKNTSHSLFRSTVQEITSLMIPTVLDNLKMKEIEIETPLQKMKTSVLKGKIIVVPILRAGLGMSQAFVNLIPEVEIGHIGVQRNPESLKAEQYYFKIPKYSQNDILILVDPMLATGASIIHSLKLLTETGVDNIKIVTIISSPEGINNVNKQFPKIPIITASIDEGLDENAYIMPGLGDAGDRIFGTEH